VSADARHLGPSVAGQGGPIRLVPRLLSRWISLVLLAFACALPLAAQDRAPVAASFAVVPGDAYVPEAALQRIEQHVRKGLARMGAFFEGMEPAPFHVVVHASAESLPEAARGSIHEGAPGMAELDTRTIRLFLREARAVPRSDIAPVVDHELVHLLLDQYAGAAARRLPRWFHEGIAQVLARDSYLGAREEDLVWRAGAGRMLRFSELAGRFPEAQGELQAAYAQSYSFVSWLEREYGLELLWRAVRMVDDKTTLMGALVQLTRRTSVELEDGWADYLRNESGARARVLLTNCFSFAMIAALPLLALALIRRLRADRIARARMDTPPPQPPENLDEGRDPPA